MYIVHHIVKLGAFDVMDDQFGYINFDLQWFSSFLSITADVLHLLTYYEIFCIIHIKILDNEN